MTSDWQTRIDTIWDDESLSPLEVVEAIDRTAAERPENDALALFERAGARDSAGLEAEAETLYRRALEGDLDDERRLRATIQLASTLRNLGKTDEALALLRRAYAHRDGSALEDEVAAFYALALVSAGDAELGVAVALDALAPHLTRYTRSVTGYAQEIADRRA